MAPAGCVGDGTGTLYPDATGWIARECNDVGVQGSWYPYGDSYAYEGVSTCIDIGLHDPSECALVTTPDPTIPGFPNQLGFMHTEGTVEMILPCVSGVMTDGCPATDYANMWGAGIGVDLNSGPPSANGESQRAAWDASAYGVIGIQFDIDAPPPALRVELAMELTDEEAAACTPPLPPGSTTDDAGQSPYWGATSSWTPSPVVEGTNTFFWSEVHPPPGAVYDFDPTRLMALRFHVVTNQVSASPFNFTISNLTFLR